MRRMLFCLALLPAFLRADVPAFVVRRDGPALRLERILLAEGRPLTLTTGAEAVAVVVPVSEGQSADLIRLKDGLVVTLEARGARLRVAVLRGGNSREVLDRSWRELQGLQVRVHVTAWDGVRGRWRIDGWNESTQEAGPVTNLFAGQIPLAQGDYVMTTQVEGKRPVASQRQAQLPLTWVKGHPTIPVHLGNRTLHAVVDLAAATSLLRPDLLPQGLKVEPAVMTEYSAAGRRNLPLQGEGAGGKVGGFGQATLTGLALGPLTLDPVSVLVPSDLPLGSAMPEMILGLDLLRPYGKMRFVRGTDGAWALHLGGTPTADPPGVTLPLVTAGAHVGVEAEVDGRRAFLVVDSGSPRTILPTSLAQALALPLAAVNGPAPRGLDGRPLSVKEAKVKRMVLGALTFDEVPVQVADLPVLAKFEGGLPVGLMGTDLLLRLSSLELDFEELKLRAWR